MSYLLLKGVHVAAVLVFVSGLLLLAMAGATRNWALAQKLRAWDRYATSPALALVWLTGLSIATQGHWFGALWLSVKLILVIGLSALHGWLSARIRRSAQAGLATAGWLTAIPQGLVIATALIALLAVTKPFS
ncbi:MAG: CopD family protein [Paludibacterium sp.]|uniref:CopD family protein n=1 Tax=Paludibacterium sp. TaxID=1917523 RepID=UPI0025FB9F5D|nr:CopD family protein [Paludibacterium sp.]MBV8048132.1 CopD family protein [Paludibacterium sp.]MBV8647750.1 CopD family protein [Paludibacterium sp.]